MCKDRVEGQFFADLFAGGFNLIDKVDGNRLANDSNIYLTSLYQELLRGWEPPEFVSQEVYLDIKNNMDCYPKHLVGFVGFGCSFGGKFFNGYAKGGFNANGLPRMYSRESKTNVLKQIKTLQGIEIHNKDYKDVPLPKNSIIYCDIPYKDTTKYKAVKNEFNYEEFYNWCIVKKQEGHEVFISEYNMPEDKFVCIWEKEVKLSLNKDTNSSRVEKLFKVK